MTVYLSRFLMMPEIWPSLSKDMQLCMVSLVQNKKELLLTKDRHTTVVIWNKMMCHHSEHNGVL